MAELFGSSSHGDGSGMDDMDDMDKGSDSSSLDSSARSYNQKKRLRSEENGVLELSERIHRKLCGFEGLPLPVKSHRSAVNSMVQLRDHLQQLGNDAEVAVRMMLLYAGVSVHRRMLTASEGEEASDLQVTLALLFMLQVLCDSKARNQTPPLVSGGISMSPSLQQYPPSETGGPVEEGTTPESPDAADAPPRPVPQRHEQETLRIWAGRSLQEIIKELEDPDADKGDWALVLRLTPDSVCRACVWEAPRMQEQGTLAGITDLASTFFRCSALTLQYNMLEAEQSGREAKSSFLTLGTVDLLQQANETMQKNNLAAIVDAAESEAGQQILRDMILSFVLPQSVVGVRRLPMLGREANAIATEHHTVLLGEAHECAMRGAEWTWENDDDVIRKTAALLAGLCILLSTGGSTDVIRKQDAFRGRVQLPFLETASPPPGTARMGFVPHRNEWIIYTVDRRGCPQVQMKSCGFEGLCMATLLLTTKFK